MVRRCVLIMVDESKTQDGKRHGLLSVTDMWAAQLLEPGSGPPCASDRKQRIRQTRR